MPTPDGPTEREAELDERLSELLIDGERDLDEADTAAMLACDFCDGSGLRTVSYAGGDADDQDCPECNPDYARVRP